VRQRQPAQEGSQFAVVGRPHHEVPVRRHDAVAEQAHGVLVERLVEHAQEGGVVGRLAEQ
jgi:hypothetical protein